MGMDSWEMKIQWRSSLRQKPVGFHDEPSEGSARYGSSLPPLIRTSPIASVSWMVIMERFQMISAKQTDGQWWKLFLLFHSSHSELWSDGQLGMQKWWNMMKKVDRIGIRIFGACLYSYSPARRTDFAAGYTNPQIGKTLSQNPEQNDEEEHSGVGQQEPFAFVNFFGWTREACALSTRGFLEWRGALKVYGCVAVIWVWGWYKKIMHLLLNGQWSLDGQQCYRFWPRTISGSGVSSIKRIGFLYLYDIYNILYCTFLYSRGAERERETYIYIHIILSYAHSTHPYRSICRIDCCATILGQGTL